MRFGLHIGSLCRAAAIGALLAGTVTPVRAQTATLTADQVKAGFIYNFTKYIYWPAPEDADPAHFHLCIAGRDGVIDQLESAVHGKMTGGRTILVRRVGDETNVKGCELLYVGDLPRAVAERLATSVNGRSVLTVGSVPRFLHGEGIITFAIYEDRVRFDINLRLAEKLNIRFESRILALARRTAEVSQ
jgi:YfiR/HmsC-like